jgi:hypothetical protein
MGTNQKTLYNPPPPQKRPYAQVDTPHPSRFTDIFSKTSVDALLVSLNLTLCGAGTPQQQYVCSKHTYVSLMRTASLRGYAPYRYDFPVCSCEVQLQNYKQLLYRYLWLHEIHNVQWFLQTIFGFNLVVLYAGEPTCLVCSFVSQCI